MEEKLIYYYLKIEIKKNLNTGSVSIFLCQTKTKKEGIFFIKENEFFVLRKKIFENTKKIIELLEERKELSEKIGNIKRILNLRVRDFQREKEIENSLNIKDEFIARSLRYLFEFSIYFQETNEIDIPWKKKKIKGEYYLLLEGDKFFIELLTGIYFGSFGKRVFLKVKIPRNIVFSFMLTGSHILTSKEHVDLPKLNYLNFYEGEASIVSNRGRLKLLIPESMESIYRKNDLVIL